MVSNWLSLRAEALLHSVNATKKPTHSAVVVDVWATISRPIPVLHVATLLPNSENVHFFLIGLDGWSLKVQQRKGTGTGRMRYLKTIPRVYKNQIKGLAKWFCPYLNIYISHPLLLQPSISSFHRHASLWSCYKAWSCDEIYSNNQINYKVTKSHHVVSWINPQSHANPQECPGNCDRECGGQHNQDNLLERAEIIGK